MASIAHPGGAQSATADSSKPNVSVRVEQTDNAQVILSAAPGSYVVVLRVSDDLKVHVLFPSSPESQRPFPLGPGYFALPLDLPPYAIGGIYATASTVPFNFSAIAKGDRWNANALILRASLSPGHAASRVFGMITPSGSIVASDEAVYMGKRTALLSQESQRNGHLPIIGYTFSSEPKIGIGLYGLSYRGDWNYPGIMTCSHGPSSGSGSCGTGISIGDFEARFPRERANTPTATTPPPPSP